MKKLQPSPGADPPTSPRNLRSAWTRGRSRSGWLAHCGIGSDSGSHGRSLADEEIKLWKRCATHLPMQRRHNPVPRNSQAKRRAESVLTWPAIIRTVEGHFVTLDTSTLSFPAQLWIEGLTVPNVWYAKCLW